MNISIELTLSPLSDQYEPQIIEFIKRLRESHFRILENPLSTQVFGPYDEVMPFLTNEIKRTMSKGVPTLVYMKLVNSDRHDYAPHLNG